jgi:iron complex transport system ATP-binding protein
MSTVRTRDGAALLAADRLRASVAGRVLIDELSFDARAGELWAILGANGAGKTTLLHTLLGLHRADAGSIHLAGRPLGDWTLAAAATIRGFLPQFIHDSFSAPVLDLVLMGRHPHLSRWQWESADDIARARSALAAMDLAALEARDVTTLSGGERQRTAIAALLAQDPQVLLLDEPIAHLDLHHQVVVLDHLARLARERDKAVLLSLHDPNLARRFATHVAILFGDASVRSGPADAVLDAPALSAAYGHPVAAIDAGAHRVFVPE